MRPLTPRGREETLAIKQKVRNIARNGTFVVDAFADAARRYSVDEDTGVTGGLLGELLPQGAVRSKELDRCCFTAPLGSVHGPVETEYPIFEAALKKVPSVFFRMPGAFLA